MRSRHLREALAQLGEVHTVLYQGGPREHRDQDWQPGWIRYARYSRGGLSAAALRQRARTRRWIGALLAQYRYDVVVVRYLSTASIVPRHAWQHLIADADDTVKTLPPGSGASAVQRALLFGRNLLTLAMARGIGHVWYVNPVDGPRLRVRRKSLLPNVIGFPEEGRQRQPAAPGRIVMVGLMSHAPNLQGLRWFAREVLPALLQEFPCIELHVIGNHDPGLEAEFRNGPVKVRGFVPDLAAEYDLAELVIAPISFGGGTQIKVIDALAHGRPLVASAFAHRGFASELRPVEHLLVADVRQEWIDCCTSVLRDREAAEAMAARGRRAAAPYDARHMVGQIREAIEAVAGK